MAKGLSREGGPALTQHSTVSLMDRFLLAIKSAGPGSVRLSC